MLEEKTKTTKYYDNVSVGKRTKQVVYICEQKDKPSMFEYYIIASDKKQSIVIVKSKKRADELCSYLNSKDIKATTIHGNHRKEKIDKGAEDFNAGNINILITTDKILQSLELKNIETIINYDLPSEHEDYFSRLILVDEVGESISFVSHEEENYLTMIEMRQKNEISKEVLDGFVSNDNTNITHPTKEKKKKSRHRNRKTKNAVKEDDTEEE